MTDATARFSDRVENYVKYRPGYPPAVLDLLVARCGLAPDSVIADVGSGTGILSELLLKNGNRVLAVEPNREMRTAAENLLIGYDTFTSIDGRAEATTLADSSVDLVVAAQAFHWFDQPGARSEFARILKAGGWTVLVWNERRLGTSPFLVDFENLFLKYGTDYARVRHENVEPDIGSFFAPHRFELESFDNLQQLDLEGLTGRVLSASYTPRPDNPDYAAMLSELNDIFATHQIHGRVVIEYDTRVYFGHLKD
jgi:ubiquinone/menaquinone biosynthesis C-methylase UbiE